ncbi:O-antigen ligase family protein [Aestuariibaculum lutulentum]|uniref:O-antigen ligase family protein n=1 Tax=Aestuariibaculum lutulentum TaxID=2920935 RepID=A0ABS9RGN4_9FLAO|nr:O-antigen ligase family protein [Aestuariibaculum lutulentum]MCH4552107.1 O-antigen ligase family protein [Aestuariibaculum lutulentum]
MNFIDRLLLFTFPFMDVGFNAFGVPFRLGELTFFLTFLRLIDLAPILNISKVHKAGLVLIFLMVTNLILTILFSRFENIDSPFYVKYILRNALYLLVMISYLLKPIKFDKIKGESFIKYILYVILIFYIIEYIDFYLVSLNWDSIFVSRQGKSIFGNFIIRFSGPSSEPAYIIPLLSIPLMYGLQTRKFKVIILSLILMILPFSSFGYVAIVFALLYFLNNIVDKELKRKIWKGVFSGMVFCCILCILFFNRISEIFAYNWLKFQAYFGLGDAYEWSASQRIGHVKLAFNLFLEAPFINMLFGNGTGYYSKMSKEFTKYYLDDAEEAHSLFFSTLTDRGFVGVLLLLFMFYAITKIRIPRNISEQNKFFFIAIKFGVLVRMLHWVFTGMLWQYYFWVEVAILLSASIYYIKVFNENQ